MTENGYTPGPWRVFRTDDYGSYRIHEAAREQNEWVSEGYGQMETDEEEAEGDRRNEIAELHDEGNRRLIQAAPELLEACEAVLKGESTDDEILNQVATAVARAKRGEA
jgi:hypothetical protein